MKHFSANLSASLMCALAFGVLGVDIANAQIRAAGGGWYVAGYGTVYGSFGQANASQNLYKTTQAQAKKTEARNAQIKKWGLAAVEKAEREAAASTSSNRNIVVAPARVVRNYGVYRPDPALDTGKALADVLGDSDEEKALVKRIYTATKTVFEKDATAKGWRNNIAAGMTFFTVTAMTVYHDSEEPSDEAVKSYFDNVSAALDETPDFGKMTNRDKQGMNDMLVGFGGLLIAGYSEGKETNNAETLSAYKKLAGMLIEMVLKCDPEDLRIENGQIVIR